MSSGGSRTRSCSCAVRGATSWPKARLNERVSAGLSDAIGRRELAEPGLDRRSPMGARRADAGGRWRGGAGRARPSWASRS